MPCTSTKSSSRVSFGVSTHLVRSRSQIQWSILDDGMLDQMGVELGKVLAKAILAQLETPDDVKGHDSSVSTRSSLIFGDKLTFFLGGRPRV